MGEGGSVPSTIVVPGTIEVNVGNTVAVTTPGSGELAVLGVTVCELERPGGVEVGDGLGGFCQTKTNPPIRRQRPNTPQPRPLNRNLSKVAISFLGDFIVSTNSKA